VKFAIPMDKRAIHLVDDLIFSIMDKEGESIYSISEEL
jgi:hypothetical protein